MVADVYVWQQTGRAQVAVEHLGRLDRAHFAYVDLDHEHAVIRVHTPRCGATVLHPPPVTLAHHDVIKLVKRAVAGMGERIMRCGTTHAVARSVSAPAPGCALEECACTGNVHA